METEVVEATIVEGATAVVVNGFVPTGIVANNGVLSTARGAAIDATDGSEQETGGGRDS